MVIYGQDEREMWLDMVKRIYAGCWVKGECEHAFGLATIGADGFIADMKERQKQEG